MNKDVVEIFLVFGCIALMPLLMTLGIIVFPILVIINLKESEINDFSEYLMRRIEVMTNAK